MAAAVTLVSPEMLEEASWKDWLVSWIMLSPFGTIISERLKAEFRAEFFNVINHANFGPVGNAILSSARAYAPGAGAILTTATDQRELEFGLKMLW